MAMNRVQFQAGMSLPAFMAKFGTEAQCRSALFRARWPDGFRCPACESAEYSTFRRERQTYYQCTGCRHQTTLLAGTLFEATKLPLTIWYLALHLLSSAKTNLSALELKRQLGVCYRTAWRLKHKVMHAMTDREESRKLNGLVQIDDAYLGGERNGGKVGRGSENKQAFLVAVETDEDLEHPRYAVIEPLRRFDNASINDWAQRRLLPDAEVYTDGLFAFRRFIDAGHAQTVLETGGGRAATEAQGARWVNIVLSNVKRSISGVYHSIRQAKYARRYLGEAAYRFNRRFHLREILPRLVHAMINCKPNPESRLRRTSNFVN
jgi:transposase-like protein